MNVNTTTSSDVSPQGGGPRVAPNQWRAFGGVWRLTAWQFLSRNHLLTVAGMLVALGFLASRFSLSHRPGGYIEWVENFFLAVVVPVLGFLSGAGAMRDQLKSSATDYVFTRPVRRWAFVIFKYVAHTVCTQLSWLPAFGVVVFFASERDTPGVASVYAGVLLAQVLALSAFVALGFLCAVLTKRYMVVGVVYAAIVEVGVGNIPAPLSRLSVTRQIRELLQPLVDGVGASFSFAGAAGTGGMVFVFCAAFVGLAALLFALQELAGERTRD